MPDDPSEPSRLASSAPQRAPRQAPKETLEATGGAVDNGSDSDSGRTATARESPWRPNVRALTTVLAGGTRVRRHGVERRKVRRSPSAKHGEQRSLFGEILDWMFAPLLLLWPMSVTFTYLVAHALASVPFDRALVERVGFLTDHLHWERNRLQADSDKLSRDVLRSESQATLYFAVRAPGGDLLMGDRELPAPRDEESASVGAARLRDDVVNGSQVRIAYTWIDTIEPGAKPPPPGRPRLALLQVAETLENRSALANEIIKGVIIPQFVVLPLAVLLVWFGLSRGLAPLDWLQARIRARPPDDLSPIDPTAAPEEMGPLVGSFNELLARLQRNLEVQRRFIADAAHQMKTPLAGLRTQAELALRQTDPEELRRSLRQIAGASERATRMVNQLLSMARADHQGSGLSPHAPLNLGELAREVVQFWVPQAICRDIDLGYEGPGNGEDVRVIGDALMLGEVLNNLLDNALRYTPCFGSVTVRVRREHAEVMLEVEDTGPGIAEAERTLVFERFYRVLGTDVDGSGLGLAIVREIVLRHDALLRVGPNPRADHAGSPGTLISISFFHTPQPHPVNRG